MLGTYYVLAVEPKTIFDAPIWASVRKPKGTRYDVYLTEQLGRPWTVLVYTRHALEASLCERAMQTGQSVRIGSRDTRWGQELVTVELATEKGTAA